MTETTTTKVETVTVDGIEYIVLERHTPESASARGHHNTARIMRENGSNLLYCKRRSGTKVYQIMEYTRVYGTSQEFVGITYSKPFTVASVI
jgi:hypothetical protein